MPITFEDKTHSNKTWVYQLWWEGKNLSLPHVSTAFSLMHPHTLSLTRSPSHHHRRIWVCLHCTGREDRERLCFEGTYCTHLPLKLIIEDSCVPMLPTSFRSMVIEREPDILSCVSDVRIPLSGRCGTQNIPCSF